MITAREKKLMLLAFAAGVTAERKERRDEYSTNSPLGMAIGWATKNGMNARWQVFETRLDKS